MAHKKGVGSSDNGRDSKSKRLGVKLFGGQQAVAGNIIIRQRGTKFHAGDNVYMGRDHTLHAGIDGVVVFKRGYKDRRFVSVIPFSEVPETPVKPVLKPTNPKTETTATPAPKPKKEAAPVAEVAEVAEAAEEKKAAPKKEKAPKLDDLKIIEGVGPKIETLLKEGGINTWAELAEAPVDRLKEILDAAGPR